MKPIQRKVFLALCIAFLLLLASYFAYTIYEQKVIKEQKKPVAVCGKTNKT